MNLSNSAFLCLDIGTYGVKGLAHSVKNGQIIKSATHFVKNPNTLYALNSVIDELEKQLNKRFSSAYITGNFGISDFRIKPDIINFSTEHKITERDVKAQIKRIIPKEGFYNLHIIPLKYKTPSMEKQIPSPINIIDTQLKSLFGVIAYEEERTSYISDMLKHAHIKPIGFWDQNFLNNEIYRTNNDRVLFIDLGAEFTTVSIWTNNGPLHFEKIKLGQSDITNVLAKSFNFSTSEADSLKIQIAKTKITTTDRFSTVSLSGPFATIQRVDVLDIFIPELTSLLESIYSQTKHYIDLYQPTRIILTGGGSSIEDINLLIEKIFNLPVINKGEIASVSALSDFIWNSHEDEIKKYEEERIRTQKRINKILNLFKRKKKIKKKVFVPIMPSTLCFDMYDDSTYTLFASSNISMIHVDIMDGFFVPEVAGSMEELAHIRSKTKAHLHVHLMTESPSILAADAINAGADTVIVSFNTAGVENALNLIKKSGKRCGIAINPETPATMLSKILPLVDEVMLMAVAPGKAGQTFDMDILQKIKALDYTRKKHGLKYIISVDGGINPETAKLCWNAGANLLVSGSYLKNAPDFRLAVQTLLKH